MRNQVVNAALGMTRAFGQFLGAAMTVSFSFICLFLGFFFLIVYSEFLAPEIISVVN